ncbi:hypothetical protein [Paludisphaera mucosa]|uniref:Uncharacterized protein n=1 Tax=Paludisphaera mucosa TaxID=3030827 RepID=A0ABT6FBK5_9BACT|nr:hypothetical protein [Paludisphaera mucosa]MDG3004926.1 hypothetical protein [Paludisphaera mucosa]
MDMDAAARKIDRRPWVVAPFVALWLAASGLIVLGRGDVESLLRFIFGHPLHPDALNYVNEVTFAVWVAWSLFVALAIAAAWRRRGDVVLILLSGAVLAILLCFAGERWSDPNWHNIACVCAIGWFVSTLVGGCYWLLARRTRPVV